MKTSTTPARLLAAAACAQLALFATSGCAAQRVDSARPAAPAPVSPGGTEVAPADFRACLERLRPQAAARGVSAATFDAHAATLVPDMSILPLLDAQPEFVTPIWDYLAALVDNDRIADGRAMLAQWAETLAAGRGGATASTRRPWSRCGGWRATSGATSARARC